MTAQSLLPRPVHVAHLPAGGEELHVQANADERAAIAADFGLVELRSLAGDVTLTPRRGAAVRVEGTVAAEIVQSCVVSLVPVVQTIAETFAVDFVPEGEAQESAPGADIVIDPDRPDPPDVYSRGVIDIGAVVLEQMALAIDPYPRAPGAELPPEGADADSERTSPFAALASLRSSRKS